MRLDTFTTAVYYNKNYNNIIMYFRLFQSFVKIYNIIIVHVVVILILVMYLHRNIRILIDQST